MTFYQNRIFSIIGSVNSGFYSRLFLSTWESGFQGVYDFGIYLIGSLVTSNSAHMGFCPLRILSTLDSALVCFCLLGSLSTWVFLYLDSVHLGVWPHDN